MASTGPGGLDELSRTLRDLRKAAGLSGMRAAGLAGFSQAKISRIEKGVNVPNAADVATLAEVYKTPPATRRHLAALAAEVKAANRRVVLARRANRSKFQAQIGRIESQSEQIREFSPIIIPGLLQTADYMRTIFTSGGTTPADAAGAIAARLERQIVLDEPGRRITIITTEGALGWAAGPASMMIRQLEHIEMVTWKPVVRVGIIPFGVPRTVFPVSNWHLYDERAVVPGILRTQVILLDPDVGPYVEQFAKLEPLAVFDGDARTILARAAGRYRELADPLTT
ncbi:MAG: helix-turn-helix domain-containing protein [Pseudonocardia sp.]